jgi:HlyD family secretion protein
MRRRLPFIALAVVIGALVAALVVTQGAGRKSDRELTGTIEAYEVQITSKVTARVTEVRCEEGQPVKAGDTLMRLDDSDYRNAALAARAQVLAAEAGLSAAASRARLAETSLARVEKLFAGGNLTRQEIDRARSEATAARDGFAAAGSAVDAARAQHELTRARMNDCVVLAPVTGTVSAVAYRLGETVLAGSVPVSIIDLDQTWLTVYLPERLLGRVKLADTCRVRIDAYPGRDFEGTLAFISGRAEFTPKDIQTREERINQVYRLKIILPNPEHILKPGMPADAFLTLH